jgi:hypothetical protein
MSKISGAKYSAVPQKLNVWSFGYCKNLARPKSAKQI